LELNFGRMINLKAYQDIRRLNRKRQKRDIKIKWDLLGLRRLKRIIRFCEEEFDNILEYNPNDNDETDEII